VGAALIKVPANRIADLSDDHQDFASSQFRKFFAILLRNVELAKQVAEEDAQTFAVGLRSKLCQFIELQSLEAGRLGFRNELETDATARFLKAALADEFLLNTEWAGRSIWRSSLLETALFRTGSAGEIVFANIERILSEREPSQRAVARLYLHILSLGFEGRYRGGSDQDRLSEFRTELFQFVYQRMPNLGDNGRRLSEQPYAYLRSSSGPNRFPRLNSWWVTFAFVTLFILGVSEAIWLWQSFPLRQVLDRAGLVLRVSLYETTSTRRG
jgi:type VI secretion system protein ImpK